jgi:hypothetical protein
MTLHRKEQCNFPETTGEINMQYLEDNEDSQEELEREDNTQNTELEDMEVDFKALIAVHGEQEINNMQVGQLRKLQRELNQRKEKGTKPRECDLVLKKPRNQN